MNGISFSRESSQPNMRSILPTWNWYEEGGEGGGEGWVGGRGGGAGKEGGGGEEEE